MSSSNIILLIGRFNDPHITGITQELGKLNEDFFLLDTLSMSDSFQVEFSNSLTTATLKTDNKKLKLDEIKSVWNSSALQVKIDQTLINESHRFVQSEWTEGIKSLWNSIDGKWVNHPSSIVESENRLRQLQMADKVGLSTPKTMVTNNRDVLLKFFEECDEEMVAKTLCSSRGLPENKMIFTTKITSSDLKHATDVQYAPCMFQEYVPKKTEFRVTIIGDVIRATEIHSQRSEKTLHDWRNYDDFKKTPYVQTSLPTDITDKLLRLTKMMKLEFGAADLIRTPDDQFIFLEVNPNGRWWWIQELTGVNIAKDIAINLSTVDGS